MRPKNDNRALKMIALILFLMILLGLANLLYVLRINSPLGEWQIVQEGQPVHEELAFDFSTMRFYRDGTFAWGGEQAGMWEKNRRHGCIAFIVSYSIEFPDGSLVGSRGQYWLYLDQDEGESARFLMAVRNNHLILFDTLVWSDFALSYDRK